MNEFINKLPLATILISFFFVCGGLYLIGFWSTFEIDITSFINLTDIPKSFVLPFVLTNGLFVLYLIFQAITTPRHHKDEQIEQPKTSVSLGRYIVSRIFSLEILLLIIFTVAVLLYDNNHTHLRYWTGFGISIAFLLQFTWVNHTSLKAFIPYSTLRQYATYMFILFPISSFVMGKVQSLKIYNNQNILTLEYRDASNKQDTLKFIGFIGDKVVVSSMDNSRITFINQSTLEIISLKKNNAR